MSRVRPACLALFAALLALPLLAGPARADVAGDEVVERAVTFQVTNTNGTDIACETDGQTYEIAGHLTGPAGELAEPDAVALYLHGLSYGEFFNTYDAQPGYDYAAEQAAAGFVSVTVDRLGYDASDTPAGAGICIGSHADIAHQIVGQLRSGEYTADGGEAPAFGQVVLAGHSVGGLIAQTEAFTFGDIDGLMVLSYSDRTVSPTAQLALTIAVTACEAGGEGVEGVEGASGSPNYVYFGAATAPQFIAAHFLVANADPVVVDTTASMRNRDPCGDIQSYEAAVANSLAGIGEIDIPVLMLTGGNDAIYPVPASEQAELFTGSDDVTAVTVAQTGHAVTLHNSAEESAARSRTG